MGSAKKTLAQKAATRSAVNARYRAKKLREGFRQVSLWVPAPVAERIAGMQRIGVVVAAPGVDCPLHGESLEYLGPDNFRPLLKT